MYVCLQNQPNDIGSTENDGLDTGRENSKVGFLVVPGCLGKGDKFLCLFLQADSERKRSYHTQLVRSLCFLCVLTHLRMGKAMQLGRKPASGAGHCLMDMSRC